MYRIMDPKFVKIEISLILMMQSTQIVHSNGENQFKETPNGQMIVSKETGGQYGNPVIQNTYQQPNSVSTPTHQGHGQQEIVAVMNSQPTPMILCQTQQYSNKYDKFTGCAGIGLGITQLVIGILCIIMAGVDIGGRSGLYFVGHGFWNGIVFIICGSFGIAAGHSKMKCPVVTFLCLSIISAAVFAPAMIITSSIGIISAFTDFYYYNNYYKSKMSQVAEGTLLCLAMLEFIISIISAAFCCHSACCCGELRPVQYVAVTGNGQGFPAGQHPQVVVLQTPTMTGGQNGTMYVQPGTSYATQPAVMQQPPAYTNQVPAYNSQTYTNPTEMAQAKKQ